MHSCLQQDPSQEEVCVRLQEHQWKETTSDCEKLVPFNYYSLFSYNPTFVLETLHTRLILNHKSYVYRLS